MKKTLLSCKNTAFCTYFDKNYLPKGLVMIESFHKFNPKGVMFVLCFDDYTENYFLKNKLKGVVPISLSQFEDTELLKAKENRSVVEYYWTCTPSLPLYLFKTCRKYEAVMYLDADMCFYNSVEGALKELGDKSIYTVEHRYPKGEESRVNISGRFNVAFQIFRKDDEGLKCLKRWREQCLEWCYWKEEEGKMGDQMYLNEWPKLYKSLVISKHLGVDVAPWNVSQYKVSKRKDSVYINEFPLICYHFHQFEIVNEKKYYYAYCYHLGTEIVKYVYEPYVTELREQFDDIKNFDKDYKFIIKNIPFKKRMIYLLFGYFGPMYWQFKTMFNKVNGK